MKLATIQTDPVFGEKDANCIQALELMRQAPADLYVLPELFASGYNFETAEEARSLSEAFRTGPTFSRLFDFAREAHCFIAFGFAEDDNGTLYNSAALIGYDGFASLYRKTHLFDREKECFTPGNLGFRVEATPCGRIGMMICFDWYFPESARTLALKGAQVIAHPSNLVLPHCPMAMPVRSLENRVFAATANRIGTEDRAGGPLTFIGRSQITSPRGDVLHRSSSDAVEAAVCEIIPEAADNKFVTERNHLFADRRPEYYWQ
ncbi:MAG: nitrilase-related carbon-nitrogen hydrolase [Acidobacteriota bacterium]